MSFENLIHSLEIVFSWPAIGLVVLGVLIGIVVGILPGVGATVGMVILIPLTLPLEGVLAVLTLIGIYSGAMYGGCISAILLNTPGTGSAAMTTLDGYPMSRQGRATNALAISAVVSSFGGIFMAIIFIIISPFLVELLLVFGSPEYFLIALLGISMIAVVSRGSMLKGIMTGMFGLWITTIGIAPRVGYPRYTFGNLDLYDGIGFIAILTGIFAISEMLKLSQEEGGIAQEEIKIEGSIRDGIENAIKHPITLLKSSLIGGLVGMLPGAGGSIASAVAYSEAKRNSDNPSSFGEGNELGVISAESADNATVIGSLIPTLSFGIPGSAATAVLLGGLIVHGIQPGPSLFQSEIHITYSIIISVLVGNILILLLGLTLISRFGIITDINTKIIIPIISVLVMLGIFSINSNFIDVIVVLVFGFLGYFMREYNYPIIPLVLGTVLGSIAETNLRRSFSLSGGSLDIFVSRPLSVLLLIATLIVILGPTVTQILKYAKSRQT